MSPSHKAVADRCSNTKTGIYLDAIHSSPTCTSIADSTPKPNAITKLEELDREETCQLALAGDMIRLLITGTLERKEVTKLIGEVEEAGYDAGSNRWGVSVAGRVISTPRLFLCTGSYPTPATFHERYNSDLTVLDLDRCMVKSTLPDLFPSNKNSVVGVIGNSHSGILCCRNLYETAQEGKRDLKILNFHRRGIRYADYRDDGIVFDNTGLKGATADWAKDVMERGSNSDILEQIELSDEDEVYRRYLPTCSHLVYAIGYTRSPLPKLYLGSERIDRKIHFDMHTSGFKRNGKLVPGLHGCGIAFPEEVEDPEGHVEAAVGVAKFFKFTERVKDDWVAA